MDRQECLSCQKGHRVYPAGLFAYHFSQREFLAGGRRSLNVDQLPVACTLSDSAFQQRRAELLATIAGAVVGRQEVNNGFAYRFPPNSKWIAELAQLITFEHACCPFLQFALRVEPANGPIWLELTGPEGTKEFVAALFG
jgi:hypothetical protein